ncbi:unnamed protein product, partial [Mesorhabditis belari]|uniref:Uncharacterized protein n=1 Tax=Mesorhabditis belari TaxID=2138241 RepID=A0AAF3FRG4_9BILA
MVEEPNIAGVRVRGFIRGCMNDVLIGGFNQTVVGWYRWMHRDSCRPYRKKELRNAAGAIYRRFADRSRTLPCGSL